LQPYREVPQLVALPKSDLLERGEELKNLLLLFCEAVHLLVLPKVQFRERGREQDTDWHSKDSRDVICPKLLQFGGREWELLFLRH
jgi:hypothetical protein